MICRSQADVWALGQALKSILRLFVVFLLRYSSSWSAAKDAFLSNASKDDYQMMIARTSSSLWQRCGQHFTFGEQKLAAFRFVTGGHQQATARHSSSRSFRSSSHRIADLFWMWSECSCLMQNFALAHSRWKIALSMTPNIEHQPRTQAP